jgi:acetyl-CoA synthetase
MFHLRFKAYVRSVHTPKDRDPVQVVRERLAIKTKRNTGGTDIFLSSITDGAAGFFGSNSEIDTGLTIPEPAVSWTNFSSLLNDASPDFQKPDVINSNNDIMLIYFTSGTNGELKMICHDFTYPLGHIAAAKYLHQAEPGSLYLSIADTDHDCAYGQWLCEAGIFLYDYDFFTPSVILEIIGKYKLTSFCASPEVYRFFIDENLKKYDLSSLKNCTVTGKPLNQEIYNRFLESTGLKLREYYEQTELTAALCTWKWLDPKPGSIGKPAPGCDIDLINKDGFSCGVYEKRQIIVRTDKYKPCGMFRGYHRAELVRHNNIYYTGDVAWKDKEGYYWLTWRNEETGGK